MVRLNPDGTEKVGVAKGSVRVGYQFTKNLVQQAKRKVKEKRAK